MYKTCDTNVVQSLYIILNRPDKIPSLEKSYSPVYMMKLFNQAKKMQSSKQKNLYVSPYVMKEIELCEKKYPGIVQFTRDNFLMKTTTSQHMIDIIVELTDRYLEEDIELNDSTRALQSAVQGEYKNGLLSRGDAQAVAENNVLYGQPFFSLNEKHLICMIESDKPNKPRRSKAILKKNEELVAEGRLHKVPKRNLKKLTATTFKVKHIDKSSEDLLKAMIQEL